MKAPRPSDMVNRLWLTQHFQLREYACKCCQTLMLHPQLPYKVQRVRDILAAPVVITSGYRCPKHNKEVNGHPQSQHMKGEAVDLRCPARTVSQLIAAAHVAGFTKLQVYGPDEEEMRLDVAGSGLSGVKTCPDPVYFLHCTF